MRFPWTPSRIYLDHASATPICREASRAYARASAACGNPGAIHAEGQAAKTLLTASREAIAQELAVKSRQIIFVSGSTEGNNLCVLGYADALERLRGSLVATHWVVSAIEHPSVLECFMEIERRGGIVTHIMPDAQGVFSDVDVARAIRPETVLISIGWANHEIGVLQPLRSIVRAVRTRAGELNISSPLVHSDMGQAPLYRSPQVHSLEIDMGVMGSGKLYGPRGIGAAYLSNRAELVARTRGGGQERGLRAGTESPALAAGFAAAIKYVSRIREEEARRVQGLRDDLAAAITARIPDAIVNTPRAHAVSHILNVSLPGTQGEYVVLGLDRAGIAVSTRSACNAGETSSHVVAALGGPEERARSTIRFSLGIQTSRKDIERCAQELARIVTERRHDIVRAWR